MNRRANIEEKDLSLSPSGISVPQADRSGEIMMGGVQNFAKALIEREDSVDSMAATAKFGDFHAAYARGKAELQKKYKATPKEYPQSAKELGDVLITQFSKDMPTGSAQKFRDMTMKFTAQDQDNIVNWSVAQEQDNVLADTQKSYSDVALAAEAILTPEGLEELLLSQNEGSLERVHSTAEPLIESTSNLKLKLETRKQAIDNSMNSQILENPMLLHGDLQRGRYDKILTPGEVKKYQDAAFDAMTKRTARAQYEGLKTTSVTISDITQRVQNHSVTVGEISRILNAYKLHENEKYPDGTPVIPPEAIEGLEKLRLIALQNVPLPKIERDMKKAVALAEFDTKWDAFQADRTNRGSVKGAREELAIYAWLLNNYQDGTIPPDEFQKKKNILDTKIASRAGKKLAGMTLQEAFKKAAQSAIVFTFLNDDDLYTAGFTMIKEQVEKDKTLTAEQRAKYKDQYFLTYIQELEKYPPDQINKIQNPMTTAVDILHGKAGAPGLFKRMVVYKHPETGEPLVYGQTTMRNGEDRVFLGTDDKGRARWGIPKGTISGFENR